MLGSRSPTVRVLSRSGSAEQEGEEEEDGDEDEDGDVEICSMGQRWFRIRI